MEIQVSKLRDALSLLEPALAGKKATLDVLKYVKMGEGTAVATNLEVAVTLDMPEAVDTLLLLPKAAMEFLGGVPGYKLATVTARDREVMITVDGTEASFHVADVGEFPPAFSPEFQHEGVMDGDALVKGLVAAQAYAAVDDTRVVLNVVCLTTGENMEAVGADGFRLGWEKISGKLAGEKPLLIPYEAVTLLERLWKKAAVPDMANIATPVQLAMAKRLIRLQWHDDTLELRFGRVTMLLKLIQGTYPNYSQLIPTALTESVTFQAEEMVRCLHQVEYLARESSGIVRLSWGDGKLRVSARAKDVGERYVTLPAQCSAPGRIAFDIRFLLNFFNGREGEVTIALTSGASGPGLFSHKGVAKAVLMPMFVEWDGKPYSKKGEPAPEAVGQTERQAPADGTPVDEEPLTDEGNDQGPDEDIPGPTDETREPVTTTTSGASEAKAPAKRRRKASKV